MQPTQQRSASGQTSWMTRLFIVAATLTGVSTVADVYATPATFIFTPPNPGWVVVLNGGKPVVDMEGDSPGSRDIVGDGANPVLYIASDATHIYFRLRVDADPRQGATSFGPYGWGCLINTDSDRMTFEYSTIVDGVDNPDQIRFYKNTVTTLPNSVEDPPDMPAVDATDSPLSAAVGHAEVIVAGSNFGGDADYFVSWAVELAPLVAVGFNPAKPASYMCGSANNGMTFGGDCSGGPTCGALDSQFNDPIGCGENGCAICGDGQKADTEGCDDGNQTNGDGCTAACLIELGQPCTDGTTCDSANCDGTTNTCVCDDDSDCPMGQICNTGAEPNQCVPSGCGNGVVEMGEGCDDGNTTAGDGCTAACLLELGQPCTDETTCDSANCDGTTHQCVCNDNADCPMGQICNTDVEPNQCVPSGCGNGLLEMGEGCDDGNTTAGDGCTAACLLELGQPCTDGTTCDSADCDGTTHQCVCNDNADCPMGQVCNTDAEPNQCVPSGCGNGVLELGEGCDDGNIMPGDGCTAACLLELGQPCTDGTTCDSANCDGTTKQCVCDDDSDCPKDQVCDTKAEPHACVPRADCTDDTQCAGGLFCDEPSGTCVACTQDTECNEGVCNETSFTCVECLLNEDCPFGGTCNAMHTCEQGGVIVEGGGILCTTSPVSPNDNSAPFALIGLLALGMTRRRRR